MSLPELLSLSELQSAQCAEYRVKLWHDESVRQPRVAAKQSVVAVGCSMHNLHVSRQLLAQSLNQRCSTTRLRRRCRMCAECHDRTGSGSGMVVQRGFPQPPSYHVPRLRDAPIGHFFDVITNGYGVMYSYATRVEPEDRWAIAAYIRALQLSHNIKASELTPTEQQKLENEQ